MTSHTDVLDIPRDILETASILGFISKVMLSP